MESQSRLSLVEVIDRDLAQRVNDQIRLQDFLLQTYEELPNSLKTELHGRIGNAVVGINFGDRVLARGKKKSIRGILESLVAIEPGHEGSVKPPEVLRQIVRSIRVTRDTVLSTLLFSHAQNQEAAFGVREGRHDFGQIVGDLLLRFLEKAARLEFQPKGLLTTDGFPQFLFIPIATHFHTSTGHLTVALLKNASKAQSLPTV